jgi:hypothetical protein
MSDETYSVVMLFTCLALLAVLWLRFRRGRLMRKLLRELEEKKKQEKD